MAEYLTDDDRDALRDWWDEDTTAGVESAFPIITRIVEARVVDALREHGDTIAKTMQDQLLAELGKRFDDYEARALPALAERIRENADAFAQFASDKKAAVLLVALLIEHASRDVVSSPGGTSDA